MMSASTSLSGSDLSITVARRGAELTSIRDSCGEWLWQGDPAIWARQSPVLFPIIGAVPGGLVRYGQQEWPMPSHGFAPLSEFALITREQARGTWRLTQSEGTLRHFPFPFRLDIEYALEGRMLAMAARVENTGAQSMPYALGFHPGFALPMPGGSGAPLAEYGIAFTHEETHLHRVTPLGLVAAQGTVDLSGRYLPLGAARLSEGAMVLGAVRSERVWLGAANRPGIGVDLGGFAQLGLWSKPGAPFFCIEPWQGLPVPAGSTAEVADLPAMTRLAPGAIREHRCVVRFGVERADWI
ncbi:MAG: hypothetical protein IOC63_22175 [Methylobacterium sp.]|nr:hypothetical protein [Methylobacterium sp.]MCA3603040.1 hypothetical protein [Methylobacterium sp.]MCA3614596.1 hypothetical protein [Methylobacterium sp.]MCA3644513.1 hypothetical protein [Methylobacterium sp.]MCA4910112.1 hypothetical protein [Methylobacterium sp.]